LADIRELMGGLDSVVGKLAEVLPQLQRLLGSQRLDVEHPNVCEYAKFLLLGLGFCLFELLIKNLSIQGQFSTQDDVLLNEKPLLAAVKRLGSGRVPPASSCLLPLACWRPLARTSGCSVRPSVAILQA
jgi:hypothetical protein